MERLRNACSAILNEVGPPSISSSTLLTSLTENSLSIVDSSAARLVTQFVSDICSKTGSGVVTAIGDELLTLDADNSTLPRLTSALTFLISVPERVAPKLPPSFLVDLDLYVPSLGQMITKHCFTAKIWDAFCKICSRRGCLGSLVTLFTIQHRTEISNEGLLVLCAALRPYPDKIAQFLTFLMLSDASATKWVLGIALQHPSLACFRNETITSDHSLPTLQHIIFDVVTRMDHPVHRSSIRQIVGALCSGDYCSRCGAHNRTVAVSSIAQAWGSAQLHEQSDESLDAIGHAMSYVLVDLDSSHVLNGDALRWLMKGISDRFELIRSRSRREEAARVATLYSRLANAENDPVFEEFPSAVADWLEGESPANSIRMNSSDQYERVRSKRSLLVSCLGLNDNLFPADPDGSFQPLGFHRTCVEAPAVLAPSVSCVAFGSKSLMSSESGTPTARGILDLLTASCPQDSDADKLEKATQALRAIPTALSSNVADNDALVANIFSLLVSVETRATRSEKVSALAACLSRSPLACLSAAHSACCGSISVTSHVDLWEALSIGAESLAARPSATVLQSTPPECRGVYPPLRSSHAAPVRCTTRWKSRRLLSSSATTWNALSSFADPFFVFALNTPRRDVGLQFGDIARLSCITNITKLLATTPHALQKWRLEIIQHCLKYVNSGPETRAAAWTTISVVASTESQPQARQQLRELLNSASWDPAPSVKAAQVRTLLSLSF